MQPNEPAALPRPLQLNGPAPDFEAMTTHGPIRLSEWNKDKWVILFSHPADFTPVCTTEFIAFSKLQAEFDKRGVALLGNSVDSVYSHIAWLENIRERFDVEVRFPVIADLDMKVSRLYGMIHEASSDTSAVRSVFFIDPERRLRAMIIYPLNLGRNFDELLRVVDALQTADRQKVALPANWRPGDKAIVPAPTTMEKVRERRADKSLEVTDWYFAKRAL